MQQYAEKNWVMFQPRGMIISGFELTNGTIIAPLLLFYLELGLICTKVCGFVAYTPVKCFNFVQSAVNARRQKDENPNSNALSKTMKLLANSSYGCPFLNRSRHSITKFRNDEKTHAAANNKMFKILGNQRSTLRREACQI